VQILGDFHFVAVVVKSKISMPLSEVGGSCPTVGSSGGDIDTAAARVMRGVSVVLTTVAVGPACATPVNEAADAPTSVPEAYKLP
jgi:hypothetical protein